MYLIVEKRGQGTNCYQPYSALLCGGMKGSYPSFSATSSKSSSLSSVKRTRNAYTLIHVHHISLSLEKL